MMTRLFATVLMVPAVGLLMAIALVLITGMTIIVCAADFIFDPGSLLRRTDSRAEVTK